MWTEALSRVRRALTPARLVAAAARRDVVDAAIELASGDIHDVATFVRLLDAVAVFREAERREQKTPQPRFPFGPRAGHSITTGTTAELERLEHWLTGVIHNQQKAQFREANLALRTAVVAELRSRR